jgi:hypothetical protein
VHAVILLETAADGFTTVAHRPGMSVGATGPMVQARRARIAKCSLLT